MCGIAGTFAYGPDAPPVDRGELIAIRDRMVSRGPDAAGEWVSADQRIGFAHRRLTIIDLTDAGLQPMFTEDGAVGITFNGEIYNYRELRRQLEQRGRQFRSTSDTEVLLHLYAEKGEAMLHDLRGMFAFAIWDNRRRGLFLARDTFGIKPLYYSDGGGVLRFASSVKALLQSRQVDTSPEPAGHVGFFLWGSVPAPYTLYAGIRNLPAGHSVWIDSAGCREPHPFATVSDVLRRADALATSDPQSAELTPDELRTHLNDSVAHHLVADVPVGVFLSSGLDSTTLASFATQSHGAVQSVTLGFDEYRGTSHDEVPLAEMAARAFGTEHQTIWVSRRDFAQEAERLFDSMDQPSIDGVNTYFVSLAARRAGLKVALSGVGGDELFGGYSSFREIPRIVRTLRSLPTVATIGRGLRVITAPLLKKFTSPKYAGLFEYGSTYGGAYLLRRGFFMPWELPEVLDPDLVRAGWERLNPMLALEATTRDLHSPRVKVSALELSWYMRHQLLRDSDWASMAHSLELRVPLLDVELLRNIAPALAGRHPPGKSEMAKAAARPLPTELLNRPKTGFTVPVREWLLNASGTNSSAVGRGMNLGDRGLRGWSQYVYSRYTSNTPAALTGSVPAARGAARSRTASAKPERRRILIYRIGQLGDTLVALPAMWAVRNAFPDAHIALLFDKHPAARYVQSPELLKGSAIFDQYIGYPFEAKLGRKAAEAARLVAMIRAQRFDTLVYLAPTTRSPSRIERDKLFFKAAGIRHFIGMNGFPQLEPKIAGVPLTRVRRESNLLLHRLARDLPAAVMGSSFELNLGARETDLLEKWLTEQKGDGARPWLAVGPGSKMPAKQWPLERFGSVVDRLIEEFDVWPVVFGGGEDRQAGQQLLERWERGYNAAGALDIRTAALALKRCMAYLGNDTGTMHLAAAVGVPCIAIFSSRERPGMWYPHGDDNVVFRSQIECEGCGLVRCVVRDNECLKRVEASDVVGAAKRIVGAQVAAASARLDAVDRYELGSAGVHSAP
jgi:asparagine synthase (glutamine-hydrolysing)